MEVLFDRVAGLDIGKASVTVCVRTPAAGRGRTSETRTFSTMTRSLLVMRDWLLDCGVSIAAMGFTSTYWKGAFYCLKAAHMKAVPGRKTYVKDAEWIAQLLEHGLLSPSLVPPANIRRMRKLTRYGVQLMGDRTRETTGWSSCSRTPNHALAPSLTTLSARATLGAMIDGGATRGCSPILQGQDAGKVRTLFASHAQLTSRHSTLRVAFRHGAVAPTWTAAAAVSTASSAGRASRPIAQRGRDGGR